jgi:hypothetical protein
MCIFTKVSRVLYSDVPFPTDSRTSGRRAAETKEENKLLLAEIFCRKYGQVQVAGWKGVYPVPNVEKEWNDNAGDTHHSPPLFWK